MSDTTETVHDDFDLVHASKCLPHRVILLKKWLELNEEDRAKFIAESEIEYLMRVGSFAEGDQFTDDYFLYIIANATNTVQPFVKAVTGRLTAMGYDTEQKQFDFAVTFFTPEERVLAIQQGMLDA